jgi:hypothetical protein
MLNVPEPVHNYATINADLWDLLPRWAHLSSKERENRERESVFFFKTAEQGSWGEGVGPVSPADRGSAGGEWQ